MRSFTSRRFRQAYRSLPEAVQRQARRSYQLFLQNPYHPSLNFKKVDTANNFYSVRIGLGHRAMGQMQGSDLVWFWIGPHSEYDRLV